MAKFAADSGSASGASEMDESSASDDDILQTSGSGEAASGSQKKDEVNEAASGSGEVVATATASPTGAAEIGSGSGSLAEGTFVRSFVRSFVRVLLVNEISHKQRFDIYFVPYSRKPRISVLVIGQSRDIIVLQETISKTTGLVTKLTVLHLYNVGRFSEIGVSIILDP